MFKTIIKLVATVLFVLGVSTTQAQNLFAPKIDYPVGTVPYSVAIGDLNGDGRPDLAVTNQNNNNVSILTSTGNGTFGVKVDFATGNRPFSVAISDLNGDGRPDLAVANFNSSTVSILTSTGSGIFGTKIDYESGSNPISIAIGDLNGDGRPDLAVANRSDYTVSVLTNSGIGTFFRVGIDFNTGNEPYSVAIGDLNGDGRPDLAIANKASNTVSVLTNSGVGGSGAFGSKVDYPTGITPYCVAIGDLNGDGRPDLAISNQGSNTISILTNTGNGTLGAKVDYASGSNPICVAIGDLNNDGRPDLAVANNGSNNVSVLTNTGSGTFGAKVDYATGTNPVSVAIDDLNGDAKLDLVVVNIGDNTISTLLTPLPTSIIGVSSPQTVCSNIVVPLSVTASGTNLTYQWYKNNLVLPEATMAIFNATLTSSAIYFVSVSGAGGNLTSTGISLQANEVTSIVTQPQSQVACPSTMATFDVSATGTNLTYVWSNGLSSTTGMMTSIFGSNYTVTVSGTCGVAVSNSVSLTERTSITGIALPSILNVAFGENSIVIIPTLSGAGLNYDSQWTYNGNLISVVFEGNAQPSDKYIRPSSPSRAIQVLSISGTDLLYDFVYSQKACALHPFTSSNPMRLVDINLIVSTVTGIFASANLTSTTSAILVSILGSGFQNGATVTVGGVELRNVIVTSNMITGRIPAGSSVLSPLIPNIVVQNPNALASVSTTFNVVVISTPTSTNLPNYQSNSFSIYPNPVVNGEWRMENGEVGATMYVYNAQGSMVYSQTITSTSTEVNTKLSSGIYLVKVGTQMVKLVVE